MGDRRQRQTEPGIVRWWKSGEFGFIRAQADIDAGISEKELMRRGADVFFHVSTVKGTVRKGQRVLFERYELSGRWRASRVVVDE